MYIRGKMQKEKIRIRILRRLLRRNCRKCRSGLFPPYMSMGKNPPHPYIQIQGRVGKPALHLKQISFLDTPLSPDQRKEWRSLPPPSPSPPPPTSCTSFVGQQQCRYGVGSGTFLKNRMNSSFSSKYHGQIHPIVQLVLMQIASAARN